MRANALLIAVALMLAGCAAEQDDTADSPDDPDATTADPGALTTLDRPSWSVGDWWTYKITLGRDFSGSPWSLTIVPTIVVTDTAGGYGTQLTQRSDALTALYWRDIWATTHDMDLNPQVPLPEDGQLRFSDFGMYAWPMEAKKSWTGPGEFFYGGSAAAGTFSFTVLSVENGTAVGQDTRVAYVVGQGAVDTVDSAGNPKQEPFNITYTYAQAAKHVSVLTMSNDTVQTLRMELQSFGTNYTGPVVDWEVTPLFERFRGVFPGSTQPELAPAPDTFSVDGDYSFLASLIGLGVYTPGRVGVTIVDGAGANRQYSQDTIGTTFEAPEQPAATGSWEVSYEIVGIGFTLVIIDGIIETIIQYQDGVPSG